MTNPGEAEIVIPDHSYPVFLALLEFLYTDVVKGCLEPDEMDQDMNFAINLLTLADQYLVEALKVCCSGEGEGSICQCFEISSLSYAELFYTSGVFLSLHSVSHILW